MSEDLSGVTAPAAGEPSGVTVPAAGEQTGVSLENAAGSQEVAEPKHVPLEALQTERQKRQEYERRLAQIERENEFYRNQMMAPKEPEKPKFAPDDFLTAGQVLEVVREEKAALEAQFRERELQAKVLQVKSKYADFDQVVEDAVQMCYETDDPNGALAALKAAGPEFAYRFGKSHPKHSQAQTIQSNKQLFDQMDKNQSRAATLTDAGGGTPANLTFAEQFKRMNPQQREEVFTQLKNGGMKLDISKGF